MQTLYVKEPSLEKRSLLGLALFAVLITAGCRRAYEDTSAPIATTRHDAVHVSGNHLLRDGAIWAPRGLNCVAFVPSPSVRTGAFGKAYNSFNRSELEAMQAWGADTIRFQVSQAALDQNDPTVPSLYDPNFLDEVVGAVRTARAIGLNVIVSMQDESGTGEAKPATLPNGGTDNAWDALAPKLMGDDGILFELMNEPEPDHTAENWGLWAKDMNRLVRIIRGHGATNVLIADGLNFAEQLDGAPVLDDPLHQVAYGAHPYAHSSADQTISGNAMPFVGWDAKFGNVSVSRTAPVIVTEWSLENDINGPADKNAFQYCDAASSEAALNLLGYLDRKGIGLLAFSYDLPNQPLLPRQGRVMLDLNGTPSTLANGASCTDATFGPGKLIQAWYRTHSVPKALL